MSLAPAPDAHPLDALSPDARIGAASDELRRIPYLDGFFGGRTVVRLDDACAGAIGWGVKRSGAQALAFARRTGRPVALLEDGFLRSVGLGKTGAPPVSIVLDEDGVYYDAARPSRLERLIATGAGERAAGASEALARWREARLSKYNLGLDAPLPDARGRIVLVDQVAGDLSLAGAGASGAVVDRIVATAQARGLREKLVLRVHPDVVAGKAQGLIAPHARRLGLPVLADDRCAPALLDEAAGVWTVSSALGFEALLRGLPVTTFAAPFYAGWGLTEDLADDDFARAAFARRGARVSLENLFACALLLYARYRDPVGGRRIDFHGAVDRIVDWRARDGDLAGPPRVFFGVKRWKRSSIVALFGGTRRSVRFAGPARPFALGRLKEGEEAVVWGMRDSPGFRKAAAARGLALHRVEDGFLRSVGLGSNMLAAGSMALDGERLYYDGSGPTRLETILAETDFAPPLRARARALREAIAARALTKYNLAAAPSVDLRALAGGREVLLVAAQVADDFAIRLGQGVVEANHGLLAAVRAENPGAFIVYKEHPDVVSGARKGGDARIIAAKADLVLRAGDMSRLYGQIDGLHVVTSLAGFEALLRGVRVTTWGLPFYAGWGLTQDRAFCDRRGRKLDLDALTAGALILYPRYADMISGCPCGPEDFVEALDALRARAPLPSGVDIFTRARRWARRLGL